MRKRSIESLALGVGMVVAAISSGVHAQPADMDPQCAAAYKSYSEEKQPKAFARGEQQVCGWWQKSPEARTMAQIRNLAVTQCTKFGGKNCRVIESRE